MTDEPAQMATIVVGVDGSFCSRRAVERAAHIARSTTAEVIAVHAMSPMAEFLSSIPDGSFRRTEVSLQETLDGLWTEPLRNHGARHRTELVMGDPAARLLECADRSQALCIVVGRTGRSSETGGTLGGTACNLLQQDRHAVMVVPRGSGRKTGPKALFRPGGAAVPSTDDEGDA
jgi:nucleotide-binding universal stress UspA family protein